MRRVRKAARFFALYAMKQHRPSYCTFTAFMFFLLIFGNGRANSASTDVTIRVIQLPNELEGQKIAFVGNLNNWDNSATVATVTNHTLSYTFGNLTLTDLPSDWIDAPNHANAGFRFVMAGTWDSAIRAYFPTNDANFRLALTPQMNNRVEIDAQGRANPIVDQAKRVSVNGVKEDSSPEITIDPRAFAFPGGKWKALIMSYDDNAIQDRDLVALFNAHGIKGSFNVNSGFLGNPDKISAAEVKSLYIAAGNHEVAIHTVSHPHLEYLESSDIRSQIGDDQSTLSDLVGTAILGMAYPFGTYNHQVLVTLQDLGVIYARTTINTLSLAIPHDFSKDLPRWNPTAHDSQAEYWGNQLIKWHKQEMALLFIWGHSWEHRDDWTALDAFCQKIGNRTDIWYAKAIEVAKYFQAITQLVYQGNSVYNPSLSQSVWIKTKAGLLELQPGHKMNLKFAQFYSRRRADKPAEMPGLSDHYSGGGKLAAEQPTPHQ